MRPICAALATWVVLFVGSAAWAHPTPFSYLDLRLQDGAIEGRLVIHDIDIAHDLGLESPNDLLDQDALGRHRDPLVRLLGGRLALLADDMALALEWGEAVTLSRRESVGVSFSAKLAGEPGVLSVRTVLFPYDPAHVTFLNVYEGGDLTQQAILDQTRASADYYLGTRQGVIRVVCRFIAEGVHHIVIGPDHVLFLIGLMLLGGGMLRLVAIVSAFTLAHSVTLSLAALDVFSPPSGIVEPAIALSIVYVGADNLLVNRNSRDVRAWIALAFGLIHGFGFASVLQELGLPRQALGWSLASFNVGVELGQIVIVLIVASIVAMVRRRSAGLARRLAVGGSVAVMAAGMYWFLDRVFFQGGV